MATEAKPKSAVTLPYTGQEYLESLDDGREVWIYGERVEGRHPPPGVPQHGADDRPPLRRAPRDPKPGGRPDRPTRGAASRTASSRADAREEQLAARDAIAAWARMTYGWLGRSPDYKAAFLGTLGANADFYAPYQANARAWYRRAPGARARSSTTPSSTRRSIGTARRAGRRVRRVRARGQGDGPRHRGQRRQGGRDADPRSPTPPSWPTTA